MMRKQQHLMLRESGHFMIIISLVNIVPYLEDP